MKMNKKNKGFSLIELSIVLFVISTIICTMYFPYKNSIKQSKITYTKSNLEVVSNAIKEYAVVHKKLPCPSGIKFDNNSANYGKELRNPNSCQESNEYGILKKNDIFVGGVPFKDLGISDKYIFDAWNNNIIYVVSEKYINDIYNDNNDTNISVSFYTKHDSNIVDNLAYVLISNGPNQYGAVSKKGKTPIGKRKDSHFEENNLFNKINGNINSKDYNNEKMDDIVIFSTVENILFEIK